MLKNKSILVYLVASLLLIGAGAMAYAVGSGKITQGSDQYATGLVVFHFTDKVKKTTPEATKENVRTVVGSLGYQFDGSNYSYSPDVQVLIRVEPGREMEAVKLLRKRYPDLYSAHTIPLVNQY